MVCLQNTINPTANQPGLHRDGVVIFADAVFLPMLASHYEHRITHTLTRERCSCGPECKGYMALITAFDHCRHLIVVAGTHDNPRYHVIKAGISSPTKSTQLVSIYLIDGNDFSQLLQ